MTFLRHKYFPKGHVIIGDSRRYWGLWLSATWYPIWKDHPWFDIQIVVNHY